MTIYEVTGTTEQAIVLRDAICHCYKYQTEIEDEDGITMVPNPESKVDFAKRMHIKWYREMVRKYKTDLAEPNNAQIQSDADLEMEGLEV